MTDITTFVAAEVLHLSASDIGDYCAHYGIPVDHETEVISDPRALCECFGADGGWNAMWIVLCDRGMSRTDESRAKYIEMQVQSALLAMRVIAQAA
jgi:hypothetical protein